jgi:gamma-glutamyltranspeptidase/glutathione hydrolase
VLQVALDVLDFHSSAEDAVATPRLHEQANPDVVVIEQKMPQTTRDALDQMHYHLRVIPNLGAVNAITIAPGNLHGAFDPRKGGGASGY